MKKLYLLLFVSNIAIATDYSNPIIDISDTRKFPPVMVVPADYQWSNTVNDTPNYKEPSPVYFYKEPCESKKINILGGCKPKVDPKKVIIKSVKKAEPALTKKTDVAPNRTRYKHI